MLAKLVAIGAQVDEYQGDNSPIWEKVWFQRGTAFHITCKKGNLGAVRLLLAYGADPLRSQRVHASEIPESSALDEAKSRGHTEIVAVLLEYLDEKT